MCVCACGRGRVLNEVCALDGRKESKEPPLKYTSNSVATYIAMAIALTFIAFICEPQPLGR